MSGRTAIRWLLGLALLASPSARASHPSVEPWMHAANVSVSGLLAVGLAAVLWRRVPKVAAVLLALAAFAGLAILGLLGSVVASL